MIELKKEKTIENLINRIRNHISNGGSNVLMIFVTLVKTKEKSSEIMKIYKRIF